MELQQFISTTLVEIIRGIEEARKQCGTCVAPRMMTSSTTEPNPGIGRDSKDGLALSLVDFDVAVTVEEQKNQNMKAGISVVGIGGGGANSESIRRSENVSRIRFKVPLRLNEYKNG
jgi:hypothetical protein